MGIQIGVLFFLAVSTLLNKIEINFICFLQQWDELF